MEWYPGSTFFYFWSFHPSTIAYEIELMCCAKTLHSMRGCVVPYHVKYLVFHSTRNIILRPQIDCKFIHRKNREDVWFAGFQAYLSLEYWSLYHPTSRRFDSFLPLPRSISFLWIGNPIKSISSFLWKPAATDSSLIEMMLGNKEQRGGPSSHLTFQKRISEPFPGHLDTNIFLEKNIRVICDAEQVLGMCNRWKMFIGKISYKDSKIVFI